MFMQAQQIVCSPFELVQHHFPLRGHGSEPMYHRLPKMSENFTAIQLAAIDCEMVLTEGRDGTLRRELARVSVVDHNLEVIIDMLVKPQYEIVNYLTPYSGLTPEIMANAIATLEDVQKEFERHFDAQTIFVGHSLEQDLRALCLVHYHVIDTAILHLREFGGFKPKLKLLCQVHLNRMVQLGPGHDSIEDACSAMLIALQQIMPQGQFAHYFSINGLEARNFFTSYEKFLQIRVYSIDGSMQWLDHFSHNLDYFFTHCKNRCGSGEVELLKTFYASNSSQSYQICVVFNIGYNGDTFEYSDAFQTLKKQCGQLDLRLTARVIQQYKLPTWVFHRGAPSRHEYCECKLVEATCDPPPKRNRRRDRRNRRDKHKKQQKAQISGTTNVLSRPIVYDSDLSSSSLSVDSAESL